MTVHVIKPDISNQWLQETGSTCTPQWSARKTALLLVPCTVMLT